ncbi:unnamed protein product [Lupinus luteus]|uniref:Uncharacterized protein n=1 Tax=Lupinus luteus TaxID=3873 RepID=A0AAV1WY71_LUPLU
MAERLTPPFPLAQSAPRNIAPPPAPVNPTSLLSLSILIPLYGLVRRGVFKLSSRWKLSAQICYIFDTGLPRKVACFQAGPAARNQEIFAGADLDLGAMPTKAGNPRIKLLPKIDERQDDLVHRNCSQSPFTCSGSNGPESERKAALSPSHKIPELAQESKCEWHFEVPHVGDRRGELPPVLDWSQRVLNDLPLTVKKVVNHLEKIHIVHPKNVSQLQPTNSPFSGTCLLLTSPPELIQPISQSAFPFTLPLFPFYFSGLGLAIDSPSGSDMTFAIYDGSGVIEASSSHSAGEQESSNPNVYYIK